MDKIPLATVARSAATVALLAAGGLIWAAMSSAPSSRWIAAGWPNPVRYQPTDRNRLDPEAVRNLVRARPLSANSLATLAYARTVAGDENQSAAALTLAGQMGWRNPAVQSFWAKAALSLGEWTIAAQRIDAMLRTHAPPELWQDDLAQLLANPKGMAAMTAQAEQQPRWFAEQLTTVNLNSLSAVELNNRLTLMERAIGKGLSVDCRAIARITNASFTDDNLVRRGEAIWMRYCDAGAAPRDGTRNLMTAPNAEENWSRFAWVSINTGRYGMSRYLDDSGKLVLHITGASSVPETVARRIMVLSPGRYRVSWSETGADGQPGDAVSFKMACMDGETMTPLTPPDGAGSGTAAATAVLEVPRAKCTAQALLLSVKPPASALSSADISISRITLSPVDTR